MPLLTPPRPPSFFESISAVRGSTELSITQPNYETEVTRVATVLPLPVTTGTCYGSTGTNAGMFSISTELPVVAPYRYKIVVLASQALVLVAVILLQLHCHCY